MPTERVPSGKRAGKDPGFPSFFRFGNFPRKRISPSCVGLSSPLWKGKDARPVLSASGVVVGVLFVIFSTWGHESLTSLRKSYPERDVKYFTLMEWFMGKGTRAFVRGQDVKLLKRENHVLKCCVKEYRFNILQYLKRNNY